MEQADKTVLIMEKGQTKPMKCMANHMGTPKQLAQSTMGIDSKSLGQNPKRQSQCTGLSTILEISTMVQQAHKNDVTGSCAHQEYTNLQKSRRRELAPTKVANPLHYHPRLTTAQLKQTLRALETKNHISRKQRPHGVIQSKTHYPNPISKWL